MPSDRTTSGRREVLKAIGATSAAVLASGVAAAEGDDGEQEQEQEESEKEEDETRPTDVARPPVIHSHFGYSGTSDDDIPERLTPDETVELHVDEDRISPPEPQSEPPDFDITVEFGAFHFEPLGLQIEEGDIVKFDFVTPEHSVTAYHPDQERQQRVPDGVAAFSSTVNEHHGFWLYNFEEPGVYDLVCVPHEWGGMGMRIVVGDNPGDVVREQGRPPLPLTGALLGSGLPPEDPDIGHPKLAPQDIVDNGPIFLADHEHGNGSSESDGDDSQGNDGDGSDENEGDTLPDDELSLDLEVTLSGPKPTPDSSES